MLQDWINSHSIPNGVQEFLNKNILNQGWEAGTVRFYSQDDFLEWNEFEDWPNLYENKMIVIGDALNGDQWAINFQGNTPTVVIISHEEMPWKDVKVIPSTVFIKVADSLEEFLSLAQKNNLPLDFYQAKDKK